MGRGAVQQGQWRLKGRAGWRKGSVFHPAKDAIMAALGIDFGTSNTAAAVLVGAQVHVIPLEPGQDTLPTAVFFDAVHKDMLIGAAAVNALTQGREGRFMRAMKSVLGTPLIREKKQFGQVRITLMQVIAQFLAQVKQRAEAHCGQTFDVALSGRPVHFHTRDPARDAQALADLTECYQMAGFAAVQFMLEPEAAALAANAGGQQRQGIGLIVDIGGGTSDFTLFQGPRILASHGVRVGGTDFDRVLSLAYVMPLLGKDSQVRAVFGPQTHTAPVALYHDLATWAAIAFLYTGETKRAMAQMAKLAVEPAKFARLLTVLDMELGHDIAFAVERGKIAANRAEGGVIDLSLVEKGLRVPLGKAQMAAGLDAYAGQIRAAAVETCAMAGVPTPDVARIVFVGGSSLMAVVEDAMRAEFPRAALEYANAFTAVVDGLAIAASAI